MMKSGRVLRDNSARKPNHNGYQNEKNMRIAFSCCLASFPVSESPLFPDHG